MAEGTVAGPFKEPSMPNFYVPPLGVVPKKTPGEYCLIHHLSYLDGDSVNDRIPSQLCTVRYTSFDTVIRMVSSCGHGAEMGRADAKPAFCLLPVHPEDFKLLGFQFEGFFYMDRALPMGCSISLAHS